MKSSTALPAARAAALKTIDQTLKGQDVQAALDVVLASSSLDPRDAGLATELVYGWLRLRGRVEYVLSTFLDSRKKLPPQVVITLGVATYEILFLNRVPDYASVNWAVERIKTLSRGRLTGLANAVLRKVTRLGPEVHEFNFYDSGDRITALSRFYSCPEWIVRLWLESYGSELTEQYLMTQAEPPPLGLAVIPDREDADQAAQSLAEHPLLIERSGQGFLFPAGVNLEGLDHHPSIVRQSFAARKAMEELCHEDWPSPVWDGCSGRGGKTGLLLEHGHTVLASDVHRGRVRALKREHPKALAFVGRADQPAPFSGPMGTVYLDLPCSGLGVLSRRPDSKYKRMDTDIQDLVVVQKRIIAQAVEILRPNGLLCLMTCTLNPSENEQLVQWVAGEHNFKIIKSSTTYPESQYGEYFFSSSMRPR